MKVEQKHIILIGFKHVGKSTAGRALANALHRPFIDLDLEIESSYETQYAIKATCRDIMKAKGEPFFRALEHQVLTKIVHLQPAVISLGGGTPLNTKNQAFLQDHLVVHIEAPKGIVFERIMAHGRPPFFSLDEDPFNAFLKLWDQRSPIYKQFSHFSVENKTSIKTLTDAIIQEIRATQ